MNEDDALYLAQAFLACMQPAPNPPKSPSCLVQQRSDVGTAPAAGDFAGAHAVQQLIISLS